MKYNAAYKKLIDEKNRISPKAIERGRFYLVKEYEYIDGHKGTFNDTSAPVIFVLYISIPKDVVHAIKVSNIAPNQIKKFFGNIYNEEDKEIEITGTSRKLYSNILSKIPTLTNESYRTYKLSGLKRILHLSMEEEKLIPKSKLNEIKRRERAEKLKEQKIKK